MPDLVLNDKLLGACIGVVVACITYLFFWNRIFGSILGIIARVILWTQDSSATWIEIGSAHLSLVTGRILLRDVKYHSSNQTFCIVKCQINWKWWLRVAAEEEDLAASPSEEKGRSRNAACRIHIALEGFEWFLYNRTASFDAILTSLFERSELDEIRSRAHESFLSRGGSSFVLGPDTIRAIKLPPFLTSFYAWLKGQLPDLDPKHLLPLSFEVSKAAITMGNHTTESILLAQFVRASGTFGIIQPRSKLDLYRQLLRMSFDKVKISLLENPDYWKSGQTLGTEVIELVPSDQKTTFPELVYKRFRKEWSRCRKGFNFFLHNRYAKPRRKEKGAKHPEDESHVGADFTKLEYAINRVIADVPKLHLLYTADVAGAVPSKHLSSADEGQRKTTKGEESIEFLDIGNGDLPPEWTIEAAMYGGSIHYGPWADRQRVQLQRVFFPLAYQDVEPFAGISEGNTRICTCLKIFFELRDNTTLVVPFREASKNWMWDNEVNVLRPGKHREAAQIQFRFGDKSTIQYLVPMIATTRGYVSELRTVLESVSISSSLNDINLLDANTCSVSAFLPSPLRWDEERTWDFAIDFETPVLYLIRDHINMLADLGKDWSSGPPSDFDTFVPMKYGIHLNMADYELNLYANDHNIIDRPLDRRDNALFTLRSSLLESSITIPSNAFRPFSTTIAFNVSTDNVDLKLTLPRWNTHALTDSFVKQLADYGHIPNFRMSGSYSYFADIRPGCSDILKLDISIPSPALKLYGWLIRYVMVLRDNYFGTFTHYSTTREYIAKREGKLFVGDPLDLKYREGKSNAFHFELSLFVEKPSFALPASILGYETSLRNDGNEVVDMGSCALLTTSCIQLQLRVHEFFMELALNIDPIDVIFLASFKNEDLTSLRLGPQPRQIRIKDIEITADRLFGPQPHTSTYVCIWDISVGEIQGALSTREAELLTAVGTAFSHGYLDAFNAPAQEFVDVIERDATFLKVSVENLDISLMANTAMIQLLLRDGLHIASNNLSGKRYKKVTSLNIPHIEARILCASGKGNLWTEAGRIVTGISSDLYSAPTGWIQETEEQEEFLLAQDAVTRRLAFMTGSQEKHKASKWMNGFFLRDITLPQVVGNREGEKVEAERDPFITAESESDNEKFVTEAMRDERLAKSRPFVEVTMPVLEEDQGTTTMDESDEAGDSDCDSTDSDWFHLEGTRLSEAQSSSSFCRSFQATGSPLRPRLIPSQSRTTLHERVFGSARKIKRSYSIPKERESVGLSTLVDDDSLDQGFSRLEIGHTSVFVTPCCASAISDFVNSSISEAKSPELLLEDLMLKWLPSLEAESISIYDAHIRSIYLCVVSDAAVPPFHSFPISTDGPAHMQGVKRVLLDTLLEGLEVLLSVPDPGTGLETKYEERQMVGKLSVRKGTAFLSTSRTSKKAKCHHALDLDEQESLQAEIEFLTLKFAQRKCQLSHEQTSVHFYSSVLESCLLFGRALSDPLKVISSSLQRSRTASASRQKHLLYVMLSHTGEMFSKDLLSTVQPSFFVQRGKPNRLRSDFIWKLLFHLRHFINDLPHHARSELLRCGEEVGDFDRWMALIDQCNLPWILEEGAKEEHIRFVHSLHPSHSDENENGGQMATIALSIQSGIVRISISALNDANESVFLVQNSETRFDLRSDEVLFDPQTISVNASTVRSFRPEAQPPQYKCLTVMGEMVLDAIHVTMYPSIIGLVEESLQAWRAIMKDRMDEEEDVNVNAKGPSENSRQFINRLLVFDIRSSLRHLLLEAAAENIVLELASRDFTTHTISHVSKPTDRAMAIDFSVSSTAGFRELSLRARERRTGQSNQGDKGTLAAFIVSSFVCYAAVQNHTPQGMALRSTVHVSSVEMQVPRSALRLYKFFEQWKEDYLLSFDAMIKSLVKEIKRKPSPRTKTTRPMPTITTMNVSVCASRLAVVLQIMHGTWLSWSLNDLVVYSKTVPSKQQAVKESGFHLSSQNIRITSDSSSDEPDQAKKLPKISLQLPSADASVTTTAKSTDALVVIDVLDVTIKPSHWDSLLSVQQKFGQDFNDLLAILGDSRQARLRRPSISTRPATPNTNMFKPFAVAAKFKGFRIGFEAPSSTGVVECFDIDTSILKSQVSSWKFTLSNLSICLLPGTFKSPKSLLTDRRHMPLLLSIDLGASKDENGTEHMASPRLRVSVMRLHGILQAHLLGNIGDFVDHIQTEIMLRKEQRAAELLAFRQKAGRVMDTFDLRPKKATASRQGRFLAKNAISVHMTNVALAFPLNVHVRNGLDATSATKALLLTARTFQFDSQKGENGSATMNDLCLQFVSGFNASDASDFLPGNHKTSNRMVYPEMTARVLTQTTSNARHLTADATISGFVLDLDPSITTYVFAAMDAYSLGRQRMERLAASIPRNMLESDPERIDQEPMHVAAGPSVVSFMKASLKFGSGTVRMHPAELSPVLLGKSIGKVDDDAEEFHLPKLSVMTEYRSASSHEPGTNEAEVRSPILVFESTVHSSHNTLRPSLLSFMTGIVHNIEKRMKMSSQETFRPIYEERLNTISPVEGSHDGASMRAISDVAPTDLQVFVSLRIDKSRLELTCKPDANVVAGLNWESGGLVVNTGPYAKGVSISASIEGLDVSLKHGFLSENSAHIDARNLNFSVNFSKIVSDSLEVVNFVSIVMDTEFKGGLQFSRLQDFMCFKAVWLDHIPILSAEPPDSSVSPSKLSSINISRESSTKQLFDTAIIMRVRQIALKVDLGQSICAVTFDLQSAFVRARLTDETVELGFNFSHIEMRAEGNLSGHLLLPDFKFRTVRRRQLLKDERMFKRMLELNVSSGTLDVQLQSDWLWLLQYHAEPLEASVYDDWSILNSSDNASDRQLELRCSVVGSRIIAMMTIMAIPKIVMYAGKFRANLEAQREGAARESAAFRAKRLPKPDNALSEVANTMFQTARARLTETESLSYAIGQHMKLQLSELVFVVLPRSQGDSELARFIGRDVMAQLHRTVHHNGEAAHRDLQLSLSHIAISQLLKPGFDPRLPNQDFDVLTAGDAFTGTENVIFSLPAMDMRMISDLSGENGEILPYDFVSKFVRQEGIRGDKISISLNISLYSWLTVLRKTFTRELKRAQDRSDWRTVVISPPNIALPRLASPDLSSQSYQFAREDVMSSSKNQTHSSTSTANHPSSPARSRPMESSLSSRKGARRGSQSFELAPLITDVLEASNRSGEDSTKSARGQTHTRQGSMSGDPSEKSAQSESAGSSKKGKEIVYHMRTRKIERLTVRQLGEATPDVMHPFFTRRAGFNLEESLPQYVHEYATLPIEEIMKALVKVYSKQLS